MKKFILLAIVLLVGLGLFIDNSFFKPSSRRIASEGGPVVDSNEAEKDLSRLGPEEFNKAFKYSLVNPMSLVHGDNEMGVQLGNFFIKGTTAEPIFVCSKYNFVELTFQAEGIAVSGEVPQMVVRGPCNNAGDMNFIQALPIPYKDILVAPVAQTQFRLPLGEGDESVMISFHYVAEFWPTEWNLVGIKLYSDYSGEILSLNGYEIIAIRGQPFTLNWQ